MKKLLLYGLIGFMALVFIIGGLRACFGKDPSTFEKDIDLVTEEPIVSVSFDPELTIKKIDSIEIKIKNLSAFYYKKTDEFEDITWYMPKNEKNTYGNSVYSYFGVGKDKNIFTPRLVIRYHGDDWLFWKSAKFLVDGDSFDFVPASSPKHDNNSEVWETSDDLFTPFLIEKFIDMASAKTVKYRLTGKFYEDFTLSQIKRNNIKAILELNKLMTEKANLELELELNKK